MARGIRKVIKALWGLEQTAIRDEHEALVNEVDELKTQFAALTAKLDADAGVGDADYTATLPLVATEAKIVK